ncbi:MAG: DUF4214 domain-containing protein [Telluria sp.]
MPDYPGTDRATLLSAAISALAGAVTVGTDEADTIHGSDGNDIIQGRGGDDWISDGAGDDTLDGGDGNDILTSTLGNDLLRGGAGNDELRVANDDAPGLAQAVRLAGDAGADHFIVLAGLNPSLVVEMEGGAGSDMFSIGSPGKGALTITDFSVGTGGDLLDLFGLGMWTGATPTVDGDYRIVQRGADTVVQADRDGSGHVDVVTLKNVNMDHLTSANFVDGFTPGGMGGGGMSGGGQFVGTNGNDILRGSLGNDRIDGGAGRDTLRLDAALSNYRITRSGAEIEVVGLGEAAAYGTDILTGIERLTFGSTGIAFDTDGAAGQVYRLYRAAFDRSPDAAGVGFWLGNMDKGVSLAAVAQEFATSKEFVDLNMSLPSSGAIVLNLYRHILDREPDVGGLAFWTNALDTGGASIADVLGAFSESPENKDAVATLIAQGVHYEF